MALDFGAGCVGGTYIFEFFTIFFVKSEAANPVIDKEQDFPTKIQSI